MFDGVGLKECRAVEKYSDQEITKRAVKRYKAFRRILRAYCSLQNIERLYSVNGVTLTIRRAGWNSYWNAILPDDGGSWGEGLDAPEAFEHLKSKLRERTNAGLHAFVTEAHRRANAGRRQLERYKRKRQIHEVSNLTNWLGG